MDHSLGCGENVPNFELGRVSLPRDDSWLLDTSSNRTIAINQDDAWCGMDALSDVTTDCLKVTPDYEQGYAHKLILTSNNLNIREEDNVSGNSTIYDIVKSVFDCLDVDFSISITSNIVMCIVNNFDTSTFKVSVGSILTHIFADYLSILGIRAFEVPKLLLTNMSCKLSLHDIYNCVDIVRNQLLVKLHGDEQVYKVNVFLLKNRNSLYNLHANILILNSLCFKDSTHLLYMHNLRSYKWYYLQYLVLTCYRSRYSESLSKNTISGDMLKSFDKQFSRVINKHSSVKRSIIYSRNKISFSICIISSPKYPFAKCIRYWRHVMKELTAEQHGHYVIKQLSDLNHIDLYPNSILFLNNKLYKLVANISKGKIAIYSRGIFIQPKYLGVIATFGNLPEDYDYYLETSRTKIDDGRIIYPWALRTECCENGMTCLSHNCHITNSSVKININCLISNTKVDSVPLSEIYDFNDATTLDNIDYYLKEGQYSNLCGVKKINICCNAKHCNCYLEFVKENSPGFVYKSQLQCEVDCMQYDEFLNMTIQDFTKIFDCVHSFDKRTYSYRMLVVSIEQEYINLRNKDNYHYTISYFLRYPCIHTFATIRIHNPYFILGLDVNIEILNDIMFSTIEEPFSGSECCSRLLLQYNYFDDFDFFYQKIKSLTNNNDLELRCSQVDHDNYQLMQDYFDKIALYDCHEIFVKSKIVATGLITLNTLKSFKYLYDNRSCIQSTIKKIGAKLREYYEDVKSKLFAKVPIRNSRTRRSRIKKKCRTQYKADVRAEMRSSNTQPQNSKILKTDCRNEFKLTIVNNTTQRPVDHINGFGLYNRFALINIRKSMLGFMNSDKYSIYYSGYKQNSILLFQNHYVIRGTENNFIIELPTCIKMFKNISKDINYKHNCNLIELFENETYNVRVLTKASIMSFHITTNRNLNRNQIYAIKQRNTIVPIYIINKSNYRFGKRKRKYILDSHVYRVRTVVADNCILSL